jgi:hypothetical protein
VVRLGLVTRKTRWAPNSISISGIDDIGQMQHVRREPDYKNNNMSTDREKGTGKRVMQQVRVILLVISK